MMRTEVRRIPAALAIFALLMTGCSLRQLVIGKVGAAVAGGRTAFAADDDPELVGDALPFTLKFMESLITEAPNNADLLTAASRGFTQYTYGWVDLPEASSKERSTRLYLRARDYGLRALSVSIRDFDRKLADDPATAVKLARKRDVPALYWTAASWGLAISGAKDDMDLLADLPAVDAMIRRAAELDPDFDNGAIDTFLITYDASTSAVSSVAAESAHAHFDRAVALSAGASAAPYVSAAEAFAVPSQDRAQFEAFLGKALTVDVNARPWTEGQAFAFHARDFKTCLSSIVVLQVTHTQLLTRPLVAR